MTPNPSDHELNEVLARVAGVMVMEHGTVRDDRTGIFNRCWRYLVNGDEEEWSPLHDANQMELVKETLREHDVFYSMQYVPMRGKHCYRLISADNTVITEKEDKSELRAFAQAVYAMDQAQKGGKQ